MKQVTQWFVEQGWQPQAFQKECWKAYTQGLNGICLLYTSDAADE